MLFVYVFLRFFDVHQVVRIIVASNRRDILIGAAIACITINLRGMRLCLCAGGKLLSPLLPVAYIYNALSALLPAKLGEVTLPLLLRYQAKTSIGIGVGILMLLRLLDLLSLGLIGSLVAAVALHSMGALYFPLALAGAGCSFASLVVLLAAGPALARIVSKHESSAHSSLRLASRIASPIAHMARARLAQLIALSVGVWISLFASFVLLAHATLDQVGLFEIGTAGAAASLAFAVPVSAVANVGPFQAAWVWTLGVFGYEPDAALASALVVHGVILLVSIVFGLFGYAGLRRSMSH